MNVKHEEHCENEVNLRAARPLVLDRQIPERQSGMAGEAVLSKDALDFLVELVILLDILRDQFDARLA